MAVPSQGSSRDSPTLRRSRTAIVALAVGAFTLLCASTGGAGTPIATPRPSSDRSRTVARSCPSLQTVRMTLRFEVKPTPPGDVPLIDRVTKFAVQCTYRDARGRGLFATLQVKGPMSPSEGRNYFDTGRDIHKKTAEVMAAMPQGRDLNEFISSNTWFAAAGATGSTPKYVVIAEVLAPGAQYGCGVSVTRNDDAISAKATLRPALNLARQLCGR